MQPVSVPADGEQGEPAAGPPAEITAHTRVTRAGLTIRLLRRLAVAEAIAFMTLLTIAVIQGVTGDAGTALFVMGNVHGAVFTTYLVCIFIFHRKLDWGPLTLLLVLLAGFIPGGGIMAERWALADSHIRAPRGTRSRIGKFFGPG
jgi:integral membrane protein